MLRRMVTTLAVVAGCGSQSAGDAKTADDADETAAGEGATLAGGTTVCLRAVLGVRYPVEDVLREQELEPVAQCRFAEVRLEETGAPGAYSLRYQKTGDSKWMQCDSPEQDRLAFLRECVVQMMDDLGGAASAPQAAGAGENSEE